MAWLMLVSAMAAVDNPLVLVAVVSVVAMLVVAQCVRYVCLVLSRKENRK